MNNAGICAYDTGAPATTVTTVSGIPFEFDIAVTWGWYENSAMTTLLAGGVGGPLHLDQFGDVLRISGTNSTRTFTTVNGGSLRALQILLVTPPPPVGACIIIR